MPGDARGLLTRRSRDKHALLDERPGEISARGRVMPVGGVKEKLLAAHRAGIKLVLIPAQNRRDLNDIPEDVQAEMQVILISTMDEILPLVLQPPRSSPSMPPPDPDAGEDAVAP